jgi:cyclic nucleotide-binding protein/N-acyl amino acid synthase FeeM
MFGWLARRYTVHQARTEEEREAIYRFRYEVYVEELHYDFGAEHDRRRLKQDEDEKPYTTLLYTGSPARITGSVRVRTWGPGEVPARDFDALSLHLFPGIEKLRVAQVGRLVIRSSLRGRLVMPSLLWGGYELLVGEAGVDLAFVDCLPGIAPHYIRLGALPYAGRLVDLGSGPGVPLLLIPSDHERLARLGSPVAALSARYFGPGQRPPLDLSPFRHLIEGDSVPVEFDRDRIWREVKGRLLGDDRPPPSVLAGLSRRSIARMAAGGFLLRVRAGTLVIREEVEEREVYLILDGTFEVMRGDRRVAVLQTGDVFGEIAFLTEAGRRTASVQARSDGLLLVLRRRFLDEVTRADPRAGARLLKNLRRFAAARLAQL